MTRLVGRTLALALALCSLLASSTTLAGGGWAFVVLVGLITGPLVWAAADEASVAAPAVTLVMASVPCMLTSDGIAPGPLVGALLGLVVSDVLAATRTVASRRPTVVRARPVALDVAASTVIAAGAMAAVLVMSIVPQQRALVIAAMVALTTVAAVVWRRRALLPAAG